MRAFVDHKRAAIAAHRGPVSDSSFFLQMPPEMFAEAFGAEWFIEHRRTTGAPDGLVVRVSSVEYAPVDRMVRLVRHGPAAAGWNVDPDPDLDDSDARRRRRLPTT